MSKPNVSSTDVSASVNAWFSSGSDRNGSVFPTTKNGKLRMPLHLNGLTPVEDEGIPEDYCCQLGCAVWPDPCPDHEGMTMEVDVESCTHRECGYGALSRCKYRSRDADEFESLRVEIRRVLVVAFVSFLCVFSLGVAYILRIGVI